MKKMLVVYYSWSNGNTERIACQLQRQMDADIMRIDTLVPYPDDYDTVVKQGKKEADSGFMPKIKPTEKSIADYDVIAVGTPTWWYTMAPAVLTFLKSNDFSGKTVIPFMTNGGWPGHVIKDMKAACVGAHIRDEMEITFDSNGGDKLETDQNTIDSWIEQIKNHGV